MTTTAMIDVSEREQALRRELKEATKELNALQHGTKEFQGKLFKVNELTLALRTERKAREARLRAVHALNGYTVSPKVFKAFKTIGLFLAILSFGWLFWSGDIKAETITSGVLITLTAICWLMYLFGYIYRKD